MNRSTDFRNFLKSILPVYLISFILYSFLMGSGMRWFLMDQSRGDLDKVTKRIQEDIIFKDGKWDLSSYNADSNIVDNNPLYIISSEGVVIERSRPINGLLDLSRFTLINQYLFPTTIETVTNEKWRVLAEPINSGDQAIGIIFTSFYQPEDNHLPQIDQDLQKVIQTVRQDLSVDGDTIDVSRVDSRKAPYNINFQVVTRFNKVLFQSNNNNTVTRMPTNIDRSYVDIQLRSDPYREVTDEVTGKNYLVSTTQIFNDKNLISGIIVTGIPLDKIYYSLTIFNILSVILGILFLIALIPISYKLFTAIHNKAKKMVIEKPIPQSIIFLKNDCKLVINGQSIDIPYASYQYYFCQSLMQKPQKKWEADELLELFGEDMGMEKWRKVYDTMVGINKKTSHLVDKLFVVKDKRYYLNPVYIKIASYINS